MNCFEPQNDGVDHINIYSQGKTELGRWLSNFSYSLISIPEHGNFNSIEGYWYWLVTRDERLRKLSGWEAKKLGKTLESKEVEGFESLILKAIDIKIKSNPKKMMEFGASTLPFDHYYVFSGVKKDAGYKWIVEHFEKRRALLKEWLSRKSP